MQTRLDYVNAMLATIGLARVSSLDSQHPQFDKANVKLDEVNQSVQSTGWWFNTSFTTLRPNTEGVITLPQQTLSIVVHPEFTHLIQRGRELYDTNNRTNVIGRAVDIRIVELVDFDDLPPTIAEYIGRRAKDEFFTDRGGSEPKLSKYNQEAQMAWIEAKKENLRQWRTRGIQTGWYKYGHMALNRRDRTT